MFGDFFIDLFLYKLVCSTLAFHKYLRYVGLLLALRCLCLCTIFYVHYTTLMPPMESPYALGLCDIFYVHCSAVLFASEAHGICQFCLANSASQDSRVSFVQDSIWIYLFFMVTWTYFTLYVGEISILRGTLYYGQH